MIDRRRVRLIEARLKYHYGDRRYLYDGVEHEAAFRAWAILHVYYEVTEHYQDWWAAEWVNAGYDFPRPWMYPARWREGRLKRDRVTAEA